MGMTGTEVRCILKRSHTFCVNLRLWERGSGLALLGFLVSYGVSLGKLSTLSSGYPRLFSVRVSVVVHF